MATPPVSPKAKRSVRRYISEQYSKLVRSHSRSPSRQSIEAAASGSGASPSSPPPRTLGGFLALPSDTQTAQLRHARSDSQLPTSPKHETQTSSKGTTRSGLQRAIEELRKVARPFPPLQSAISSLIPCLGLLEVNSSPDQCIHIDRVSNLDRSKEQKRVSGYRIRAKKPERVSNGTHERHELDSDVQVYCKCCHVSAQVACETD